MSWNLSSVTQEGRNQASGMFNSAPPLILSNPVGYFSELCISSHVDKGPPK